MQAAAARASMARIFSKGSDDPADVSKGSNGGEDVSKGSNGGEDGTGCAGGAGGAGGAAPGVEEAGRAGGARGEAAGAHAGGAGGAGGGSAARAGRRDRDRRGAYEDGRRFSLDPGRFLGEADRCAPPPRRPAAPPPRCPAAPPPRRPAAPRSTPAVAAAAAAAAATAALRSASRGARAGCFGPRSRAVRGSWWRPSAASRRNHEPTALPLDLFCALHHPVASPSRPPPPLSLPAAPRLDPPPPPPGGSLRRRSRAGAPRWCSSRTEAPARRAAPRPCGAVAAVFIQAPLPLSPYLSLSLPISPTPQSYTGPPFPPDTPKHLHGARARAVAWACPPRAPASARATQYRHPRPARAARPRRRARSTCSRWCAAARACVGRDVSD